MRPPLRVKRLSWRLNSSKTAFHLGRVTEKSDFIVLQLRGATCVSIDHFDFPRTCRRLHEERIAGKGESVDAGLEQSAIDVHQDAFRSRRRREFQSNITGAAFDRHAQLGRFDFKIVGHVHRLRQTRRRSVGDGQGQRAGVVFQTRFLKFFLTVSCQRAKELFFLQASYGSFPQK